MLGVFLIAIAELFAEASTSIGKYEVAKKKESLYAMGFLSSIWATVFLVAIGYYQGDFHFALASLPTFALRSVLEVVLVFVTLNAILTADRSTFTFLRTLTIPLLLVADFLLGYTLTVMQVLGVSLMAVAIILLYFNHGMSRRGKMLSVLSAILAVGTITLYKYNITHYNSVAAEQAYLHAIVLVALVIAAWVRVRENVFRSLVKPIMLVQSLLAGVATVFLSFAFLFAPASVIMAAKRSFEVLAAILFGQTYFKEKHVLLKLTAFVLVAAGVTLLVL